jgi:hypothetical protein
MDEASVAEAMLIHGWTVAAIGTRDEVTARRGWTISERWVNQERLAELETLPRTEQTAGHGRALGVTCWAGTNLPTHVSSVSRLKKWR